MSDARLQLAERQYLYPDLLVACGEQSGTLLTNPTVVIKVLSPTTEKHDRGAKFASYKALQSIQEYVLIGSEYASIEVHRREGNFWRQYHYHAGDPVELKSLGIKFPFDPASVERERLPHCVNCDSLAHIPPATPGRVLVRSAGNRRTALKLLC